MKPKLTYRTAPSALADGRLEFDTRWAVYGTSGELLLDTTCQESANRLAESLGIEDCHPEP